MFPRISRLLWSRGRRQVPHGRFFSSLSSNASRRAFFGATAAFLTGTTAVLSSSSSLCFSGMFSNVYAKDKDEPDKRDEPLDQDLVDSIVEYASKGNIARIRQLYKAGAISTRELNALHTFGFNALHVACCNGHTELELGANPDVQDNYDPRKQAPREHASHARQGRYAVQERENLIVGIAPHVPTKGWTPLHFACAFGHTDIVDILLQHHANPELKNSMGVTCDHALANRKVKPEIEKLLLDGRKQRTKRLWDEAKAKRVAHPLEDQLKEIMVGQVMPIESISASLRRRDNGWHDPNKPLVYLMLGSSGVGKTMLAKEVATRIRPDGLASEADPDAGFIRLDMSEYAEKHTAAKFIGAPPGYVGHEQGGQLTKQLKKYPDAVVLLDEVEKAHPDVLNVMLQVFDEGRLTDGQGETVHCKNAVFIMTSNLVQDEIRDHINRIRPTDDTFEARSKATLIANTQEFLKETVHPILKRHFKRDEFLGRINEMLVFHPFDQRDLRNIVRMELQRWKKQAAEWHDMKISWTDEVVDELTKGYDDKYGFRSVKHEVQRSVVNVLAYAHERDFITSGSSVHLDLIGDEIVIANVENVEETTKKESKSVWQRVTGT